MVPRLITGNEGLSSENNLLPQRGQESHLTNQHFFTQLREDVTSAPSSRPPIAAMASSTLGKNKGSLGRNAKRPKEISNRTSAMNFTALSSEKQLSVKGASSIRTLIRLANSREN